MCLSCAPTDKQRPAPSSPRSFFAILHDAARADCSCLQSVEKCFASFNGSHKYLEDMCKAEVDGKTLAKVRANRGSGLVATVWLLRHLLFVTRFIRYLLEMDPATPSECAKKTYDEVRRCAVRLSRRQGGRLARATGVSSLHTR